MSGRAPIFGKLEQLPKFKPSATEGQWTARCPGLAHKRGDRSASLSIHENEYGKAVLKCHTGCTVEEIVTALDATMADLFPPGEGGRHTRSDNSATAQHSFTGCTLAAYAKAKDLPIASLKMYGLSEIKYLSEPAVRIPYRDENGVETAAQFRVELHKRADGEDCRFRWRSGSKATLYGQWRLPAARTRGTIALVEGASDCHTLWFHGFDAVGIPGAGAWDEKRDAAHLDGFTTIYVVIEPDQGGETVRKWLSTSRIRERVRVVTLPKETKDPSALYLRDVAQFRTNWQAALDKSLPWTEQEQAETAARAKDAWKRCQALAEKPDILAHFAAELAQRGVVGEERAAKLLYLCITSRLLNEPVSAVMKGPSSGGKSYLTERVLGFFPPSASYALSAMSERALAYSEEPIAHRVLVVYEAAGLTGEFASYLARSLLSEGKIVYETVEKTAQGLRARLIEREGPAALLMTTTAVHLHPENETRLLSIPITDTQDQTRRIFEALASERATAADLSAWQALQEWLGAGPSSATIPYAAALARQVQPVATRLRRDFRMLLNLIRSHALLHRASRKRDKRGWVVATIGDYRAVRELVADLVAEGVGATVSAPTKATVGAVKQLLDGKGEGATVSISSLKDALHLDKGTVSRRVRVALDAGYLLNLETGKGRPSKLVVGDPLPAEVEVLPTADTLEECCSGASVQEGTATSPPPGGSAAPSPRAAPRNCVMPVEHSRFPFLWHDDRPELGDWVCVANSCMGSLVVAGKGA
jgi:hypothetical protein